MTAPPRPASRPAAPAPCRILMLGDGNGRSSSHEQLFRLFGTVRFRDIAPSAVEADAEADLLVTSGLRLADDAVFRALEILRRQHRGAEPPVLCLLDRPTRRDAVRLKLLGDAALLPEDAGAAAVMAALHRQGRAPRELPSGPAGDAGMVLADALSRAASGAAIDRSSCAAASGAVAEALADRGMSAWMRLVEAIHDPTYRHCLLVSGLVSAFARHLGFSAADVALFTEAAMLHDLGKALVPAGIIDKPGPLSEAEGEVMRRHPEDGFDLLFRQGGFDPTVLAVVRSHHELLDGSGYPDGLFRHQIPAAVRIATICDIFAALIETRSYKPGLSIAAALLALDDWGDKLDRRYVTAFRECLQPLFTPEGSPPRPDAAES